MFADQLACIVPALSPYTAVYMCRKIMSKIKIPTLAGVTIIKTPFVSYEYLTKVQLHYLLSKGKVRIIIFMAASFFQG